MFFYTLFVLTWVSFVYSADSATSKNIVYQRCKTNVWYSDITVNFTTEQILDFRPPDDRPYPVLPARLTVKVTGANVSFPLFVTASQQESIRSWQLPMKVMNIFNMEVYYDFSRTLCPTNLDSPANWPEVHLSTESPQNISVKLMVELLDNFNIPLANDTDVEEGWTTVSIQSNKPQYYQFRFPDHKKNHSSVLPIKSPQTVILMLKSETALCTTVSVQNLSCPVYDDEENVKHRGDYLTMLESGGITVSQAHYPVGFYVVLLLKTSDAECEEGNGAVVEGDRTEVLRMKIIPTISYQEYIIAATVFLGGLLAYIVLVMFASYSARYCRPSSSTDVSINSSNTEETNVLNREESRDEADGRSAEAASSSLLSAPPPTTHISTAPTLSELCVATECARKSRSDKYLFIVGLVAALYLLPSAQLVATYQVMLHRSGDQDLCYYNFLCAHPLGPLSDFNHVYSNAGYVLLGSVFLFLVHRQQKKYIRHPSLQELGIPQHFGIFYAMGVSLIVEGLLSATYHFCPNKMNFQFDSSFMYVMCVLCMVKLYQARHPDANARAHSTFSVLAVLIFIGFSEVLFTYVSPPVYSAYWVVLLCLKFLFIAWLACKIYYMGDWDVTYLSTAVTRMHQGQLIVQWTPRYPHTFFFLTIILLANLAMDAYGFHLALNHARDIPVQLLQVLVLNTILYIAFYISCKLKHKERVTARALFSLVVSNLLWGFSLYFFINGRTKWAWTPARSRNRNGPCAVLSFFDTHDIWHLTSAMALFHTFCLLLHIDDDLLLVDRSHISVF